MKGYRVTHDGQVIVTPQSLRERVNKYREIAKKLVEAYKIQREGTKKDGR